MPSRDVPADACTVRLATAEDAHLLQTVLDHAAGANGTDVYGLKAGELLDVHHVHLAFVSGEPIGCVMATPATATILHGLTIVPSHRKRGHASTLISAAITHHDVARGSHSYWTAVDANLAGASERFGALGFEPAGEARYELTLMIRRAPAIEAGRRSSEPAMRNVAA